MLTDLEIKMAAIKELLFKIKMKAALSLVYLGLKLMKASDLPKDHRFWQELAKMVGSHFKPVE